MNIEAALLAKILESGDFRELTKNGIGADSFYDLEYREFYLYLADHFSKHGEVPSPELLAEAYPDVELDEADDSLSALIEQMQQKRIYNETANVLEKASVELRNDPVEAAQQIRKKMSSILTNVTKNEDIDITQLKEEIRAEYLRMKRKKGNVGIPWPWPLLNDATLGMHPGNLIFIYGRPKSMKTWVMMYVCHCVHYYFRKSPVFASMEMGQEDIRKRAVSLFTSVDYQKLRSGQLTTKQEREFFDNLEAWEESAPYIVTSLQRTGAEAVLEFEEKLVEHDADIGFFDGVYLAGNEWEDMIALTRGLKRLAKKLKIPIIGTVQENREGNTAYSDSFLQDCDLLMRTKRGKDEEKNNEIVITTPAMREARLNGFAIHAYPATNFSEKFTIEEEQERNDNFKQE